MPFDNQIQTSMLFIGSVVPLFLLAGCGGGGPGSAPTSPGAHDATAARRAAAAVRAVRVQEHLPGVASDSIALVDKPGTDVLIPTYVDGQDGATGLYYHLTYSTGLASQRDFFADSAHTIPAGSFVSQPPNWTNGDYPVSVNSQVTGFEGISGQMSFTKYFMGVDTGHTSIYLTDQYGETIDLDMSFVDVRGTDKVQASSSLGTLNLTYQSALGLSGTETGSYMDSSGNTGSLTIQADGSANLVIRSGSGQALVTENANAAGQLTIQFPDGTSQSVANIDMVDPAGILLV